MDTHTPRLVFFGTASIASPVLSLLTTMPIHVVGAVSQQHPPKSVLLEGIAPVTKIASDNHIPIFQPKRIDQDFFSKTLSPLNPDLCLLFAYGKIIPAELLTMVPKGWVNIHPSVLPKFRGPSPIQYAIISGETTTGVTLIKMDEGVDTGPIICVSEKLEIHDNDTYASLSKKLAQVAVDVVSRSLIPYLHEELKPSKQKEAFASQTYKIRKEEGNINWQLPASTICRYIRAYMPWPGTYTFFGKTRMRILSAAPMHAERATPGLIEIKKNSLFIGAGNNSTCRIDTIQREGKKPQPIQEFLRGFSFTKDSLRASETPTS